MRRIITTGARSAAHRRTVGGVLLVLLLSSWATTAAAAGLDIGEPFAFSPRDPTRSPAANSLRVRGALTLRTRVEGHAIPREISGLAYSADDRVLYAVTDAGWLLHLAPRFADGELVGIDLLARHRLADAQGRALARVDADAEGLAALAGADGQAGNTRLVVSFEGRPRLAEHATDGRQLRAHALRAPLVDPARYDSRNHGLEALAFHPTHGYLLAPERPLRGAVRKGVTLYAQDGRQWIYPVEDVTTQSLTGLASLGDGSLLALERHYAGPFLPVVCTISHLRFDGTQLAIARLARYSSAEGWPVDNFEAIAVHRARHYFIASDDNEHPLQRALLIYLEWPADE